MSYFKIFRMAAGTLFWALALLSPAGVSSQTLELSGAQVVTSGDDPLVRKAAEVLVDELALRTGVTLSVAGTADGVQILIGRESDLAAGNAALGRELGALPPTGTEGYKLLVAEDGKCVVVAGNDPRGVLYGVGRLLRSCELRNGSIHLRRQRFHRLPSMRSGGMNCILRRGPSLPTKHGPRRTSNSMSANWRFSG